MDSDTTWTQGPTLSAWIYDSPRGAAAGKVRLDRLGQRGAVVVIDVATVTWVRGAHRPRFGRPHVDTVLGPSARSPLEALLERLVPSGAGSEDHLHELARELRGTGLDADFLRQLRERMVPDSSALLVLSRQADLQEVRPVIERGRARGDVRLLLAALEADGLHRLEALASLDDAVDTGPAC